MISYSLNIYTTQCLKVSFFRYDFTKREEVFVRLFKNTCFLKLTCTTLLLINEQIIIPVLRFFPLILNVVCRFVVYLCIVIYIRGYLTLISFIDHSFSFDIKSIQRCTAFLQFDSLTPT